MKEVHKELEKIKERTSEDGEGQGGLACWGPWAGKESDMTG